jgi:ubiquinone/menaquinone biosynthesis C-methylase UbiE
MNDVGSKEIVRTILDSRTGAGLVRIRSNLFQQAGLPVSGFEEGYLQIRAKEGRVYTSDMVARLPHVSGPASQKREWRIRKRSADLLVAYLLQHAKPSPSIMELGCGNGWLSARLATIEGSDVLAVDVLMNELSTGADVFAHLPNLTFCNGNIFSLDLPEQSMDYVVLAASIPYFRDISSLIKKLLTMLSDSGEIHIIDSPVYQTDNVAFARQRSIRHFNERGTSLEPFYFHHSWEDFKTFKYNVLRQRSRLVDMLLRRRSPFPWIRITK